jgi:hypothetical protein
MAALTEGARRAGAAAGAAEPAGTTDPALLAVVGSTGELGPAERLEIYAGMYRARLVDVLREDFPRVRALLGDDAFAALGCRYLAWSPSMHPSARHVGGRFAEFVATDASAPPFLAELARLEWARVQVFDAADAEPLSLAELRSIPPADWPTLGFRRVPASLVIESAWPVHRIWAEAETWGNARLKPVPEPTIVRVWREERGVSHAAMGAAELRALRALDRGETLAALCAAVALGHDPDAAAAEVGAILLRWIEDGLLAR